jgi:hypothetical protein
VSLSIDQRGVLLGMASAVLFALAFVAGAFALGVFTAPTVPTRAGRVVWALGCDVFAALALLAGIARVAAARFFGDEIDGSLPPRARALEIDRAVLANTVEQLVLLVFAHVGLALALPDRALPVIPILVALFLVGRVTFWLGYRRSPPARAFGFGVTFYPTAAALLYAVWRLAAA